jgi:hypothetical protein
MGANRIRLVLNGMQNRIFCPYLARYQEDSLPEGCDGRCQATWATVGHGHPKTLSHFRGPASRRFKRALGVTMTSGDGQAPLWPEDTASM